MLKSAVFERSAEIHRKWLSLPPLTTKTINFCIFLLLLGGKTDCDVFLMYTINHFAVGNKSETLENYFDMLATFEY